MDFVTGAITEPKETDPKYATREAENSAAMPQLLNSLQSEISKGLGLLQQ